MLIDGTRRPLRLVFEECPTVLVVRTMAVTGVNSGMLHRTGFTRFGRGGAECQPHRLQHQAMVPKGNKMYMETLLPVPLANQVRNTRNNNPQNFAGIRSDPNDPNVSVVPEPMAWDEPYNVTTGYQDETSKQSELWTLNFIWSKGRVSEQSPQATTALLSILDETHGHTLTTIQIKLKDYEYQEGLFSIATPLRRYIKQSEAHTKTTNLWQALMDEDL